MGYRELLAYRLHLIKLNPSVPFLANQATLITLYQPEYQYQMRPDGIHMYVFMSMFWNTSTISNEEINKVDQKILVFSITEKENLTNVVHVMLYFAEATDILQAEKYPTSSSFIPVIDSLENAPYLEIAN